MAVGCLLSEVDRLEVFLGETCQRRGSPSIYPGLVSFLASISRHVDAWSEIEIKEDYKATSRLHVFNSVGVGSHSKIVNWKKRKSTFPQRK